MLVLSRKLDESIRIGDEVRITVVQIRPGRVRLGIDAPPHVRVRRQEVPPRIDLGGVALDGEGELELLVSEDSCGLAHAPCR